MSSFSIPAITAFVEATAGIIRLTTPVKTKHRALGFPINSIERLLLDRIISKGGSESTLKGPGISVTNRYNGMLL